MIQVLWYLLNGRAFANELDVRFKGHVGVWAAILVCLTQAEQRGELVSAEEFEQSLQRLRRFSWRHTNSRALEALKQSGDLKGQQSSHVAEVVLHNWGHAHGLDLAARALDGELDIAPRKIGDRTSESLIGRPERRKGRPIEFQFVDVAALEVLADKTAKSAKRRPGPGEVEERYISESDARRQVALLADEVPDLEKIAAALLKTDGNISETAKLLGVSRRCAKLSWELKRLQTLWFDDVA